MEQFYVGLHQASDAQHFSHCCIHVGRLGTRQKLLGCEVLLLDSQAFRILELHGEHQLTPLQYAATAARLAKLCGRVVVVTQDYMCEKYIFQKRLEHTGVRFTVADHQRLTIARYDALHFHATQRGLVVMPVLQGYKPSEYVDHIQQYGRRLAFGAWVGVGSVCKRNGDINKIAEVLIAIKQARPDLRLHGFGLKTTALASDLIESLLHTADSMAWSYAARRQGGDANDWRGAESFVQKLATQPLRQHAYQHRMAI